MFRNFLELHRDILESLNTPVKISDVQKEGSFTYLYFNIGDKEFRAVIELSHDGDAGLVFEQKIDDVFTYSGIQDNLSTGESLALFSTLKTLIPYLAKNNYIFTDSKKKLRLYLKILNTIPEIKSINYKENSIPYVIGFSYSERIEPVFSKFKSKI